MAWSPAVPRHDGDDSRRRAIWHRRRTRNEPAAITSGIGHYYGKYGFDALTHAKSILVSPADVAIDHLFPPYTDEKVKALAMVRLLTQLIIPRDGRWRESMSTGRHHNQ